MAADSFASSCPYAPGEGAEDPHLLRYLEGVATLQDHRIQTRLLKELVRDYVALGRRIDALLKNTLPAEVADEIRDAGGFTPRACRCTILFSDMVGFTRLAEHLTGEALIGLLDRLFRTMDDLVLAHGGTKIKTIGDAYMAVFGTPRPLPDHAIRAVRTGLAFLSALRELNGETAQALALRIGIHTGTVMAGVVGKERMQFDVFGDAVNIASRFESSGIPGRVNVSEATYLESREHFPFEPRGEIPLKHKANMGAYLVREG